MKTNPEDMVTKKEFSVAMKRMVTKTEFKVAMKKIDGRFQGIDDRFQGIDDRLQSIDDRLQSIDDKLNGHDEKFGDMAKTFKSINARFENIEHVIEDIKANMYTKQDHARDMVWMDKAMVEIEAAREERILSGRLKLRTDDIVFDHEKRIRVLEKR